jgi:ribosomal protein S10
MRQYYLKISSKNEKSLKKFLTFFFKHLKTKFNIIQKSVIAHNHKKIITLLKSPHVNKTAQEHFESRIFSKQILLKSYSIDKNLIFLKKIINRLFQDIAVSLKLINNLKINNNNRLLVFCADNYILSKPRPLQKNIIRNTQKKISKNNIFVKNSFIKFASFLNMISVFGEILIYDEK